MKKVLIFMIMIYFLTSCASYFRYDYNNLKNDVVSAEIIDISYEKQSDNSFKTIINLVNIIDNDKLDGLFNDLSDISILEKVGSPKAAEGKCLKLVFSNGEYEIIYKHSIDRFKSDGTFLNYKNVGISSTVFIDLVSKYTLD